MKINIIKNITIKILTITFIVMHLSGCTEINNKDNEITYEKVPNGSPALKCVLIGGGDYEKLYEVIPKFEKNSGIKVNIVFKANHFDLDKKLRMDFAADTVDYDVFSDHSSFYTQYIPYTEPLGSYFSPEYLSDFLPRLLDAGKKDGYLWQIPRHADIASIYYRTDLFDDPKRKAEYKAEFKRDLKVPETWDEYVEVAKFFSKDGHIYGTQFPGKEEALTGRFYELLTSLGGEFIGPDGKCAFNSEAGVKAVSMLRDLYTSGAMPKDMLNYLWDDVARNFASGKIAFYLDYYNWYSLFQNKEASKVAGKFGLARQPAGPSGIHGGWGGVHGFSITKASTNKANAAKFIKYVASPENQYIEAKIGYLPVRRSLWDKVIAEAESSNDPLAKKRLELAKLQLSEDFFTPPLIEAWVPASNLLFPRIQSVILGEIQPQKALDDAAEEINKLLEDSNNE